MNIKPNHVCANARCPYGVNGRPKEYYACDACDRNSYRVLACSPECYAEVIKVLSGKSEVKPQRTDKTEAEVKEIMTKPIEQVVTETKTELKDYAEQIDSVGIEKVVDMINDEIEAAKPVKKRRRSTKTSG